MHKNNKEINRKNQRRLECEEALNGSNTFVSMEFKYRDQNGRQKGDWYLTFQCTEMDCRRIWTSRADLITQPNNPRRCPCIKSPGGFDPTKPGTWYLLLFTLEQFIKAGITNYTVAQRYLREPSPYEVLKEIDFPDGQKCWDYEHEFLRKWKEFKHTPENKLKVRGDTECFKLQILPELGMKIPEKFNITGDLSKFFE